MADLIEIGIQADIRPVNNLISALGKASNAATLADKNLRSLDQALKRNLGGSVDKLLSAFSRLERAGMSLSDVQRGLAQDSKMLAQANQAQVNSLLGVDRASKSARNSAQAMVEVFKKQDRAAKEAASADAALAREKDQLIRKLNPLRSASMLYEKELNDITRATQLGVISDRQRQQSLDALNAEFQAFTTGVQGAAMANNRFGVQSQMAGRQTNQLGVLMQQTGYQVGDFAVQVQGGTNVMVALGQQATQLVGTFGMLAKSTRMIGVFAGLGILIPILTGVGAYFLRMRDAAKEAAEGVDTLADSIKSLDSSLKDYLQTKKASRLGITVEELLGTQNIGEAEAELDSAREALDRLITSASVTTTGMFAGVALVDFINQKLATDKVTAAVLRLAQAEETLGILRQKQAEERFANYAEERVSLEDQLAMAQEIARFGEDSAQVSRLELEQRIAAFDRNIDQQVASNDLNVIHARALKSINAEIARTEAGYISVEEKLQRVSREIEAATKFKLSDVFDAASRAIDGMNSRLGVTLGQLGGIMSSINSVLLDTVSVQAEAEALANGASASAASNAARIAREIATLTGGGTAEDLTASQTVVILALTKALEDNATASDKLKAKQDALREAAKSSKKELTDLQKEIDKLNKTAAEGITPFDKYNTALKNLDVLRAAGLSDAAYSMEIERLNDELAKSLPMVNDVANAFGDFLARGLTDFKSFANSIFKSFQNMLAQMIATAARNRILISMGATGSVAGPASAASNLSQGAGIMGGVGTFASSVGTGLGVVGSGFMAGGLGGAATASMGAISGGIGMGGLAGFGTALGAAIPIIGAVALVFGALRKTTKELDSGLNVTVKNMDALVTSFKTVQTSRFFGLSKKTSTSTGGVSNEVSDPIVAAVTQIQQSVLDAAAAFGIGSDAFDNFSYEFKLSLKGLSEDQQMQKINEELAKMGDSFASLTGHFETMNELLEAANQRMELQNRLDQLLGNNQAILTRQRQAELAAMNELNRPLAQAIYDLEDAQAAVANAFTALRASIDNVIKGLTEQLGVANEAMNRSKSIYDMLSNALSSRKVSGDAAFIGRRSAAQSFLSAGDFRDEEQLREALSVVAEPSEGLFSSFVDYARDFGRTSYIIEEAKNLAQVQLSADEQAVALLEKQIEQAEAQYQIQVDQYNALLGIDTSVKSVTEAIGTLREAIEELVSAQAAAKAAASAGIGGGGSAGSPFKNLGSYSPENALGKNPLPESAVGKPYLQIRGEQNLISAAQSAGVPTTGKSGAEIQQALSNSLGAVINMDNATRAKQFAMGGYHTGGVRMVGERGPELEATGPSRIFSHNQTASMFKDPDLKEAVSGLREEVAGLRSEQRQIQMDISKYTKRTYDIERKWDVEGLPATRT